MDSAANIWPTLDQARSFLKNGTGRGIKIAVLDSGIEIAHPQLNGMELLDDLALVSEGFGTGLVPGQGNDLFGHGTAIADIIRQIAPEAQIGSFRVLGDKLRSRSLLIREGARQAIDRGYDILNCSFGCGREDQVLLYKDWIDAAYIHGRHIVAACNNEDSIKREWPAHFPSVLGVAFARSERLDQLFCRTGNLVEFAARGDDIEVAWKGSGKKKVIGSSFAAAHLSGLLARLLSSCPGLSPAHVKALFQRLADPWPTA